jgi:hypothetical protein
MGEYRLNSEQLQRRVKVPGTICNAHRVHARIPTPPVSWARSLRRYDMNRRSQMQGGNNWILPKEIKCKPILLRLSLAGNLEKPLTSMSL